MEKLHVNFMKDLRNHEFVELYSQIINYIKKQQVDDTNVNIAFEMVKSNEMKLLNMGVRKRSSFSIENKKLTRLRNDYLISLRLRVKSYLLSHIAAERDAAQHIHFVIKPYRKEYYVPTILPQTRLADDLKEHLKHNKDFREAVSLLGLSDLIGTIIDMTAEIIVNYQLRVNESGETKSKRAGVKEAAYRDMKIMADAINFMAVINQHNEEKMAIVEELIYSIDGIMKNFRTAMKSRNTKRKNRKAVGVGMMQVIKLQREKQKLLPVGVGESENEPSAESVTVQLPSSGTLSSITSEHTPLSDSERVVSIDLETLPVIGADSIIKRGILDDSAKKDWHYLPKIKQEGDFTHSEVMMK